VRIFLDTANIEEIKRCIGTGSISGVTTNPSIISRENKPLEKCIEDIKNINSDITVLVEAISKNSDGMVKEARGFTKMGSNIVVKLPMTSEGLEATKILSKEGISIAVTLVFSVNQAIAASCAGADYVAPFVGRLDDINSDGLSLVSSIKKTFNVQAADTRVIAASIRTPQSVSMLFREGCDIVTMPGSVFEAMLKHPLTDAGLKKFEEDWKKVPNT
jgi:transaldolase